jgi:hypothetical protein
MPAHSSCFSDVTVVFVQNGKVILTLSNDALSFNDYTLTFTLTEEQSFMFEAGHIAELQLRAQTTLGQVIVSDIKQIAIMKKYPEDI